MARSSAAMRTLVCVLVACIVLSAPLRTEAAFNCGSAVSILQPCLPYLQRGAALAAGCCSGVRNLNAATKTTADRQAACNCLKRLASSYTGLNYKRVAGLPGQCRVSISYRISPSTDCSKVR